MGQGQERNITSSPTPTWPNASSVNYNIAGPRNSGRAWAVLSCKIERSCVLSCVTLSGDVTLGIGGKVERNRSLQDNINSRILINT